MRAVIYARYSTDLQNVASIDDQVRLCREHIERDGHKLVQVYNDRAVSGATLIRPGIQSLMQDASRGKFDLVYAEALDRISRDQEGAAGFFKRMHFAAVKILTLAEGEISELHVGLKGTMNALFLKDLAQKTRRGLQGRVLQGLSGGGLCFGYDLLPGETRPKAQRKRNPGPFGSTMVRYGHPRSLYARYRDPQQRTLRRPPRMESSHVS
jgi:site-specific DNA recombinase